jgi:hypothetical protein
MPTLPKYKQFISELLRQFAIVLGANVVIDTANRIEGLVVNENNIITEMVGDPNTIAKSVIAEFDKLSPQLTAFLTHTLLIRYPNIAKLVRGNATSVSVTCLLKQSHL